MVWCVSFTGVVSNRQEIDCEANTDGFSFWGVAKAPTADQLPKICASSRCMEIVAAMKKAQPTECTAPFGLSLYREVINPIEAVCSGKPVAATPAPAATPTATPAPTPPSTVSPPAATTTPSPAPGTDAPQASPASPSANGTAALGSTNAAAPAVTTAPPASHLSTTGTTGLAVPMSVVPAPALTDAKRGLSTAAIVGIVGGIVVVLLVLVSVIIFQRRRSTTDKLPDSNCHDPTSMSRWRPAR